MPIIERVFDPELVGDDNWRASLNPRQLEAVTAGDGPVLVIAGAGTGKTWTLACRVAYLIERGTPPERILLLTFSRRAAREMLSRAERLIRTSVQRRAGTTGKVWGGTFHAIANRVLRLHGRPLGLSPDFTVLDQADMADLMDLIRGEHLARPPDAQPSLPEASAPESPSAGAARADRDPRGERDARADRDPRGERDPRADRDPRGERDARADRDPRGGRGTRDTPERRFPRKDTLVAIYSRMVNAGEPLSSVLQHAFPWCLDDADRIRAIFADYTHRKRAQNVLDYDDLLLYWRALGTTSAGLEIARRFDHVLVDEYQDTNPLQAQILQALCRHSHERLGNLMVVGDDAQSIYSFRAASVRNILDFPEQFPGARRITLDQNYRSTRPILDVSNAVIAYARERFPKDLWPVRAGGARPVLVTCEDENGQSRQVCDQILEHREQGTPLRHQAVLFRTGHHSDVLELELTRRNIPFVKYGGLKFLETAHIKDVLAILRILENPRDEVAWFRVLQLLDGIGPAGARKIMHAIGVHARASLPAASSPAVSFSLPASSASVAGMPSRAGSASPAGSSESPLKTFLDSPPRVPEATLESLEHLRAAFADCLCGDEPLPPAAEIARIRRFCEPIFQQRYGSPDARLHDIDQLENVAAAQFAAHASLSPTAATSHSARGRFLAELALDPPTSTSDLAGPPLLDEDYLILSTVHSAKGGEWDVVHLIHAADGMIPSDMSTGDQDAIEEERRLLYVALTRARDNLYVYFSLRYYRHPRGLDDAHHYAQLSRFLPERVQSLFERRSSVSATTSPAMARYDTSARANVDQLLASLWSG